MATKIKSEIAKALADEAAEVLSRNERGSVPNAMKNLADHLAKHVVHLQEQLRERQSLLHRIEPVLFSPDEIAKLDPGMRMRIYEMAIANCRENQKLLQFLHDHVGEGVHSLNQLKALEAELTREQRFENDPLFQGALAKIREKIALERRLRNRRG